VVKNKKALRELLGSERLLTNSPLSLLAPVASASSPSTEEGDPGGRSRARVFVGSIMMSEPRTKIMGLLGK
jgi:hypothetical protein